MAISAEDKNFLVSLYVGYFNRAPDPAGLQFWIDQVEAGRDTNTIAADFAASPEAKSLYPFLTTPDVSSPTSFITAVYANLFNRAPDAAGQAFWEAQLSSGAVSPADAIDAIIKGATTAPDSTILTNKNTVGLDFATDAGNTPGFVYDAAAAAAAVSAISGVTEDAATVVTAQAATDAFLGGVANPGQTLDLTTGVDTIVATSGNDTINGAFKVVDGGADLATLGGLDTIDGGAGVDTLEIANQENTGVTVAAASVSNVENLNVRSADGAVVADVSNFAGMTSVTVESGTAGGSDVDIDTKANVTSVSVKGGQVDAGDTISIDDTNTAAGGDKLASVTLDGVADATAGGDVVAIGSDALTSLTVKNTSVGATVTAAAGTRDLSVNLDNVTGGTITDAQATSLTINATGGKSSGLTVSAAEANTVAVNAAVDTALTLSAGDAESVSVSGAGKTTFNSALNGADLTSVDASSNSGGVTATIDTDVAYTGGTGVDNITVGATSKAVALGAGDDVFNASIAAATDGSIDGGEGTDTVALSAANAETLSAGTAFEADISNFEKVSLGEVAEGQTETVNLANLDDISYVVTSGTAAGTAAGADAEVTTFTFADLKSGQSVTVNGYTLTANNSDVTGAELAAAFAAEATTGNVAVTGAETHASSSVAAGAAVTVTADAVGVQGDLTVVNNAAAAPTAPAIVTTDGVVPVAGVAEVFTATFSGFATGADTITFDGHTVSLADGDNVNAIAAKVAAATANFTNWNAVNNGNGSVTFTAAAVGAQTDVTAGNFVVADVAGVGAPTVSVATDTQGVDIVAGSTETAAVTWNALKSGQSVTVAGRTVTALQDLTAEEVATAFEGGVTIASANLSGTLAGWSVADNGVGVSTFTALSTNTNVTDLAASTANSTLAANPAVTVTTQGTATGGAGNLVLTGLANGATVELTDANEGSTTVSLADANGTADTVNLKLNGAANLAAGSVNVAGVETIAIETADSTTTSNPTAASTLTLNATSATNLTISGNHGVDLTGSTLTKLTTLDASGVAGDTAVGTAAANGVAGAVTFTTAVTDSAVTVTTGNGNDVIDASSVGTAVSSTVAATITTGAGADIVTGGADADVINTGSESDTVKSSTGADSITLGAGNDTFALGNATHSVLATRDVISDFSANTYGAGTNGAVNGSGANGVAATSLTGDLIDLNAVMNAAITSIDVNVVSNAADAQTFIQNTADASATQSGIALDSSTGLLYIDLDSNGSIDSVLELTGVTTIDEAAFLF
ncbi:DUF4214 domain-containing protein [Phaeobacter italicus]|uniref:DUF4214 domain-containing protein n=1 Tax=Phaeobacter italicus TaxID=481446 RepID=UPI001ADA714D|nr:DUF4214 domain-containing protein [Phaeobacter italicus]MBO9444119.1 DUF4214 domain-containing protein [Phaeobacter italicus]